MGVIGGILVFVTSLSTPPSASAGRTKLGDSTLDWTKGEVRLKTNLRPVTQQDLLESAERKGQSGGKFVADHADSFSFGNKVASHDKDA